MTKKEKLDVAIAALKNLTTATDPEMAHPIEIVHRIIMQSIFDI